MKEVKIINKINNIKMKNKEIKSNHITNLKEMTKNKEKKKGNIIDKIIQLEDKMKSKKKKKEKIFKLKDKMKSKENKKENIIDKIMKLEDLILYSVTMKERMTEKESKKISKYNINSTDLLICMMVKISLISNQSKLM